jgi:hypothetical protein
MRTAAVVGAGLVCLTAGCSWGRFDDLVDSAPVVMLDEGDAVSSGFGSTLSTARNGDQVRLLGTGAPGANGGALFSLGTGQGPNPDPVDSGHCEPDGDPCFLGRQTAGLGLFANPASPDEDLDLCFVSGVGSKPTQGNGLLVRCDDDSEFVLRVPAGRVTDAVDAAVDGADPVVATLAADRNAAPALLAGVPSVQAAWFYAPRSFLPIELAPPVPQADDSYGTTVAVAEGESARLFAVGAPGENHVWLFRVPTGGAPEAVGCLGGPRGFGRALAAGRVNGDTTDDLVIADDVNVTVFDGANVLDLESGATLADCSLASLPAGSVIASFGCGSTRDVTGCASSEFGAAVAVGDLDGDGAGEIAVGAPRMKVRDVAQAGAVLLYDVGSDAAILLADAQFLSSAESGDLLGLAIATPEIDGRHIVAAGAPGGGKVALFYCNDLLSSALAGRRCE